MVALAVPAAALAGSGNGCSACQVYHEQAPSPTGGPSSGSGTKPVAVPHHAAHTFKRALRHAGKDASLLNKMIRNPGYGATRELSSVSVGPVAAPSTLAAAVDLGPGPTTLLAILIGSAVVLLVGTGWRSWRRRRGRLAT